MTRPKGSKNIPWVRIVAKLRQHPDRWLMLPELASVSYRTIEVIRRRQRPILRLPDGVVRCRRRAVALLEDGTAIVTLAAKFEPHRKEDK